MEATEEGLGGLGRQGLIEALDHEVLDAELGQAGDRAPSDRRAGPAAAAQDRRRVWIEGHDHGRGSPTMRLCHEASDDATWPRWMPSKAPMVATIRRSGGRASRLVWRSTLRFGLGLEEDLLGVEPASLEPRHGGQTSVRVADATVPSPRRPGAIPIAVPIAGTRASVGARTIWPRSSAWRSPPPRLIDGNASSPASAGSRRPDPRPAASPARTRPDRVPAQA